MGRQRRAASGAVKLNPEPLIDETVPEEGIQCPPHRFDVFVLASDVRRLHVDPVAHAFGQALPEVLVLEHGLAALGVEAVDAVLLDLFLVPDPELSLDLDLHRQSVRVPSGLAVYLVSAHRLVPAHEVLDRSRHYMMDAGLAVRGWRSLIKREVGSIGAVHALFEDAVGLPDLERVFFESGKARFVRQSREHPTNLTWRRVRFSPLVAEAGFGGAAFRITGAQ